GLRNLNGGDRTGAYLQTAFSPKVGIVYQLLKDRLSLFGNYMNGFRNVAPVTQPLPDISGIFDPQRANQLEGGVKLDAFQNRLTFTASYYDINVTNVTRSEQVERDGQFYNITVQDGEQLSRGFELDLVARPVEGDRKSTRLNSSHVKISYAVFCLKKKNNNRIILIRPEKNKGLIPDNTSLNCLPDCQNRQAT